MIPETSVGGSLPPFNEFPYKVESTATYAEKMEAEAKNSRWQADKVIYNPDAVYKSAFGVENSASPRFALDAKNAPPMTGGSDYKFPATNDGSPYRVNQLGNASILQGGYSYVGFIMNVLPWGGPSLSPMESTMDANLLDPFNVNKYVKPVMMLGGQRGIAFGLPSTTGMPPVGRIPDFVYVETNVVSAIIESTAIEPDSNMMRAGYGISPIFVALKDQQYHRTQAELPLWMSAISGLYRIDDRKTDGELIARMGGTYTDMFFGQPNEPIYISQAGGAKFYPSIGAANDANALGTASSVLTHRTYLLAVKQQQEQQATIVFSAGAAMSGDRVMVIPASQFFELQRDPVFLYKDTGIAPTSAGVGQQPIPVSFGQGGMLPQLGGGPMYYKSDPFWGSGGVYFLVLPDVHFAQAGWILPKQGSSTGEICMNIKMFSTAVFELEATNMFGEHDGRRKVFENKRTDNNSFPIFTEVERSKYHSTVQVTPVPNGSFGTLPGSILTYINFAISKKTDLGIINIEVLASDSYNNQEFVKWITLGNVTTGSPTSGAYNVVSTTDLQQQAMAAGRNALTTLGSDPATKHMQREFHTMFGSNMKEQADMVKGRNWNREARKSGNYGEVVVHRNSMEAVEEVNKKAHSNAEASVDAQLGAIEAEKQNKENVERSAIRANIALEDAAKALKKNNEGTTDAQPASAAQPKNK